MRPDQYRSLRDGLLAVRNLIEESHGVAGLHLNDDNAPWDSLQSGGKYEEWLCKYDAALDTLVELDRLQEYAE